MRRTVLTLRIAAIGLRCLSHCLHVWPLAFLAWIAFAEISPHMLLHSHNRYSHNGKCVYLGVRGFQTPSHATRCPLLALLNTETGDIP